MTEKSDDSQWAFDYRPWEGGRWQGDVGNSSMKELFPEGKMVHIGFCSEWNLEETRNRSWTEPLVPGAEKAKHGSFNEFRYVCCNDRNCGVRVSVAQGPDQAWYFRRARPLRGSKKPHTCVSRHLWAPESVFHSLTKGNIKRILSTNSWKQEFGIKEVQTESQVKFNRHGEEIIFKPDVLVTLQNDSKIYIEVVYTNSPTRLKHELYGEGMAVIDLTDERNNLVLYANEEQRVINFKQWVKEEGIESVLRQKLPFENRRRDYIAREEMYNDQNRTVESEFFEEIWKQVNNSGAYLSSRSKQMIEDALRPGLSKQEIQALFDNAIETDRINTQYHTLVDSLRYLTPGWQSYFWHLVKVLESWKFNHLKFGITIEEAKNVHQILKDWNSERGKKISYIDEHNIEDEMELLQSLGLSLDVFNLEGLDDWTLMKEYYWKLNPLEEYFFMQSDDYLHVRMRMARDR